VDNEKARQHSYMGAEVPFSQGKEGKWVKKIVGKNESKKAKEDTSWTGGRFA